MTNFAVSNKCKLKGIIDYEIAKILGHSNFFIPVFYSDITRPLASVDAIKNTDYLEEAKSALIFTVKYLKEQGIDGIDIEEVHKDLKVNINGFYDLQGYKVSIKPKK